MKHLALTLALLLLLLLLLLPHTAAAQTDSDGDGVDDTRDLCNGVDASFFDGDGDGCVDPTANARHREFWDAADLPLRYVIHEAGAPGIGDDSEFAAIQAGFAAWTTMPEVALSAVYEGTTAQAAADGTDGVNQVTFADPEFLAVYGNAVLAVGITTSYDVPTPGPGGQTLRPGQIFDADMIFNPVRDFATDTAGAGIDLQSVATHEAGHLFGIAHAAVVSSTMFPALPGGTSARSLQPEDRLVAFMSYPEPAALATSSTLSGHVLAGIDLSGVGGAAVFAISTATGDTLGGQYTLADGSWQFTGLPADSYVVAIAPLEGAAANGVVPALVNSYVEAVATDRIWPAEYWDLSESAGDDPMAADPVFVGSGAQVTDVDVITNVDLVAPALTTLAPDEGAAIRVDAVFFVEFSEAMDFSSATTSFELDRLDAGGPTGLAFSLVQVAEGDVFLIDPSMELDYGTSYRLTVRGTVSDRSGNPLGADLTRTWTTEDAPPLLIATASPSTVVEGTVVVLYGEGFDRNDPGANVVDFAGQLVGASTATANALSVSVPDGIPAGTFDVRVQLGAQTSNALPLARATAVDVVRGTDFAVIPVPGTPAALVALPDGAFSYAATSAGLSMVSTGLTAPDFGALTNLAFPFGFDDLEVSADGKRLYAVSRSGQRLVVLDTDHGDPGAPNANFNTVIDELVTSGRPTGIELDASGERAFVATSGGLVEIWDIEPGSATWHRQIGQLVSPVPSLEGAMAVNRTGTRLFAMASAGDLLTFDLTSPGSAPARRFIGSAPRDLVLDPRGNVLYATDGSGLVSVVLAGDGTLSQNLPVGGAPNGFVVDATGTRGWFADRANDELGVLDLVSGSPSFRTVTSRVPTGAQPVDVVALPDGLFVLSAEAGSQTLRLIGIGAGPELTGIAPATGRAGDWFVISGHGFAPTGEGLLSALEWLESSPEEIPYTRVLFGDVSVRPLSATAERVAVRAPDGWAGEPIRVSWNGPSVEGSPTTLLSNALRVDLLEPSPADLAETANRAVYLGESQGYPWAQEGLNGSVAVSPTGAFALVVSLAPRIYRVDADPRSPDQGQVLADMVPTSSPVTGSLAISPDGRRAWFAAADDQVHVLDTDPSSPTFMAELGVLLDSTGNPPSMSPGRVHVVPSGQLLVVEDRGQGGVSVFRIAGEAPYAIDDPLFSAPDGVPTGLSIHPSGLWAVYSAADGNLHRVCLNENRLVFGSQTWELPPTKGTPLDVAFTPDGSGLAVVSWSDEDGGSYWLELVRPWLLTPYIFNPNSLRQLASGVGAGEATIAISPDGDRAFVDVAASAESYFIDIVHAGWGRIDRVETLPRASASPRRTLAFEPRGVGLYLAGAGDDGVEYFDFADAVAGGFVSGYDQVGVAGEPLAAPVVFAVTDGEGRPAAGAVAEVFADGGGALGNGRPYQWLTTSSDGLIAIDWTMGPAVDGDPGSPANNLRVTLNGGAILADPIDVLAVDDPTTVPLRVAELRPAEDAVDVSVSTTLQVRFSRAIEPATARGSEYFLRRQDDQSVVAVSYGYADGNRSASMVPELPLRSSTVYEIVAGAGIRDADGGPLANPVVAAFTTQAVPVLSAGSISPPAAVAGTQVVIAGTGFAPNPADNTIVFSGRSTVATGGGEDQLTAFVPIGATSGQVRVLSGGIQSNPLDFSVLLPELSPLDQVVTTVRTGSPVVSLAVTPDGLKAYSVSSQANQIVPVDMLTFTVGEPIEVGVAPTAIAIHPAGSTAYVTNYGSASVSVIDVATDRVIETIAVGGNPTDIVPSPNGDWLYVVNSGDETLSVIDIDGGSAAYHTVVATAGSTRTTSGAAIRPDGSLLYLGTPDGFAIFDLDPEAYGVVASIGTTKTTQGAAITPDGSLLFLLTTENEVLVVDVSQGGSNAVVASVMTDASATGAAISPDGSRLYLLQEGSNEVYVYEIVVDYSVSSGVISGPVTIRADLIDVIEVAADPTTIAVDPSGSGIVVVGHGTGDGLLTFLNTSSLVREEVLAEVTLDPNELDPLLGGRGVLARICLPSGVAAGELDVSSLLLGGSISVVPGSERVETGAIGEPDCLVVSFDRLEYQAYFPQPVAARQVQAPPGQVLLSLTATLQGTSVGVSGAVAVDPRRPVLLTPEPGSGYWEGRPMHISWSEPGEPRAPSVDIRITEDGGITWRDVVLGLPNDGDQWIDAPFGVSQEALIEVVFLEGEQIRGVAISEGFFRLDFKAVPVTMGDVRTRIEGGSALLSWRVADAGSIEGFHVLRADREDGAFARITDAPVAAATGPEGPAFAFTDDGILGNREYLYLLEEVRPDGVLFRHGPYRLTWNLENELRQNVPNSFNPRTTITFSIAQDGPTRLAVYNLAGRLVDVLVSETLRSNTYHATWDGTDRDGRAVASGVYVYHLTAPGFSAARKMTLLR